MLQNVIFVNNNSRTRLAYRAYAHDVMAAILAFQNNETAAMRVKALANEDTMLPTQMFPGLPGRATFVADTKVVSGTQKMFLSFYNILCPQQMFPSLRSPRNIMSNKMSTTMCPRLPVPLRVFFPVV